MKKVTISLDEEVARWARVYAAQHDTSLSRMLGEELRRKMLSETQYDSARERFFARKVRALKSSDAKYPTRDSLYER